MDRELTNPPGRLPLAERLAQPGHKWILSLDGGGIRGLIACGILAEIEREIRRDGDDGAVLSDYFDLVGGASTGSLIATCVALGWPVDEITELYLSAGPKIFGVGNRDSIGIFEPVFSTWPLHKAIRKVVGDRTLSSPDFRTGLAVFVHQVNTDTGWVVVNNPESLFWDESEGFGGHKHFRVAALLEGSCSAPYYFKDARVRLTDKRTVSFADAAIAGYNCPELKMLQIACLSGYGFNWQLGADRMSLLSIGTGYIYGGFKVFKDFNIGQAMERLSRVLVSTSHNSVTLLQSISNTIYSPNIDPVLEKSTKPMTDRPVVNYVRADADLWAELPASTIKDVANSNAARKKVTRRLLDMTNAGKDNMRNLYEIGVKKGAEVVRAVKESGGGFPIAK